MKSSEIVVVVPVELIKSETIPPSPNRRSESIDWLSDYSGLSWIAYGASSLLVISHFPAPLSHKKTLTAPLYRQVMELSNHDSSIVKAVAWSPSIPSRGVIAVAIDNCICLCSDTSPNTRGSFYWIQVAVLAQCYTVDALSWTGSGDGIISAGIEVVLWKKKGRSWEIAWKCTPNQPQTMVSATWSTGGLVATAASLNNKLSSLHRDASTHALVFISKMDEKAGYVKIELRHPQPVSMIQWRPSIGSHSLRDVLLTCCLDGTLRLWSEIDNGKAKHMKRSFHVIAVIEINQSVNGTLGMDTFVTWAAEIRSVSHGGEISWASTSETFAHDIPARCEWLVGYGPGMSLTFWAIHCLDDISPLRFPRATLWKTLDLADAGGHNLQGAGNLNYKDHPLFLKTIISRSQLQGPPTLCSLLQLLSDNSMGWSQLYSLESCNTQDELLSLDGHSGNILQVAVHPSGCEVEFAVSLDANGLLLFWHLSRISSCVIGMPAQVPPAWEVVGKVATRNLPSVEYSCLSWAPSAFDDYNVLVLGNSAGIDCFIIQIAENEVEKMVYHKLGTIPFTDHDRIDGPISILAISLPSTCTKSFISNNFMLLGIWMNEFQALSWKVTLHLADLGGSICDCNFDVRGAVTEFDTWKYESSFAGKNYCLIAESCSSKLPNSHNHGQVTSVAVVPPGSRMPTGQEKCPSLNDLYCSSAPYQMATGYYDGNLRLWRTTCSITSTSHSGLAYSSWELVGMFNAHQGPVTAISLSFSGGKIATVSMENYQGKNGILCIWQPVRIIDAGNVLLEDKISLSGVVVALNWFSVGNGQLLLGVCMENELRVFAQRSSESQIVVKSEEPLETHIWYCIARGSSAVAARDFLWGPGATPVLVHERYFCLFSNWSFQTDKEHQAMFHIQCLKDDSPSCMDGADKEFCCFVYNDCIMCNINELSLKGLSKRCKPKLPSKLNVKSDYPVCNLFSTKDQQQCGSGTKQGIRSILEVAGKLRGYLPIYHPEALLLNLYSGNWKRARVAVHHLAGNLTMDNTSVPCENAYNRTKPNVANPQINLSKYLEELLSISLDNNGLWDRDPDLVSSAAQFKINSINFTGHDTDADGLSNAFNPSSGKSEFSGFIDTVEKFNDITGLTSMERMQMLAVIDLLGEICDPSSVSAYKSLDEPGRRFWVVLRFHQLYYRRKFGGSKATDMLVVDSGMIGWAFQSECQDILLASFLSNEPSWEEIRNLGAGFWFSNTKQLRTKMEKLARSQYLKNKDPKDCALLYIALNRLQVLAGLFKISKDEKDKPLVGFLSRNFQDEKNKAAALKNAYVLMGQHQLELAVAFFLLGGDTSSAVSVCAKTLGDEQLALVICRLIDGNGGPLEHHLISKLLLPAAMERGDYWLVSLFEWTMGNYVQAFLRLLGFKMDQLNNRSVLPSNQAAFLDPKIGQYCLLLAKKNMLKSYAGESAALVLARWAALMTFIALNRRGLPIEALQCLSSSLNIIGHKVDGSQVELGHHGIPHGILGSSDGASNWLSGDVALHMESNDKLDLALSYISAFIMEHPSCTDTMLSSFKPLVCNEDMSCQYKLSLEKFQHKLNAVLEIFGRKYSLNPVDMLNMILVYSSNNGMLFLGYHILHGYTSREFPQGENQTFDNIIQYPSLPKLFLKAAEEVSCFFAQYLMYCSIAFSPQNPSFPLHKLSGTSQSHQLHAWDIYMKRSIHLLESLRATVSMYCPNFLREDLMMKIFSVLDLLEYYISFMSAWLQKNLKCLILAIYPILMIYKDGRRPSDVDIETLKKHLCQNVNLSLDSRSDDVERVSATLCEQSQHEQCKESLVSIPDDERWQILGACLWKHLFNFSRDLLKSFPDNLTTKSSSRSHIGRISSMIHVNRSSGSDRKLTIDALMQVPGFFAELLDNTLASIASSQMNQLASLLSFKLEKGLFVPTLSWLETYNHSQSVSAYNCLEQDIDSLRRMSSENEASLFGLLWEMCVDPAEMCRALSQENMCWLQSISRKFSKAWKDLNNGTRSEYRKGDTLNEDQVSFSSCSSATGESVSPGEKCSQDNYGVPKFRQKGATLIMDDAKFHNPKEIYNRNGELLEAMCINSINQKQAAVASNRKGLQFFKWKDEELFRDPSEYIWSEADWPQNGWAGSESIPIPTFVSPGIGLGIKKGAHLGLGGATLGLGSLARSTRDLTGDRAFGIHNYGSVHDSGLGWGTQEDFEFVDPPATVDNISTRALSSHPSRPFFLAGSSNTHVYLWEFGKEKATATYGVLPAANVPPPYALASVAKLQFDHCGHRFVTAALDGTICTWQLEVGGRNNIHPTESSICFNRHSADVTYVAASGSVIAAAGYSSDGVNVVVWDTLAPTTTSQASLICHEGGARAVSVFNNDLGSGSISPLIVTGGKGGDVGLHDFRFIATGKTKRHRHSNINEQKSSANKTRSGVSIESGEQNSKGMLWYIPKAHIGSITTIATIPDTSFFLTGSKDGDVKLWDAKKSQLVFHWPKLHERHTFLQPSSRGFGGIVRAAVTDIQVISQGFLTCGGDGTVKMVQIKDFPET